MKFLYRTITEWENRETLASRDDNWRTTHTQMLVGLMQQEKTDGKHVIENGKGIRQWTTLAAAEEWKNFLETLQPGPSSITIEANS